MIRSYWLQNKVLEYRRKKRILHHRSALVSEVKQHAKLTSSLSLIYREKKILSQYGEGGITASLLHQFGCKQGAILEFGFSIFENNSIATVLGTDRQGFYIDASKKEIAKANAVIKKGRLGDKVNIMESLVTVENINHLIEDLKLCGEMDYLSIDIDGNDYWIWNEIDQVSPRIVSIEYNASFGPTESVSVPYRADFDRFKLNKTGLCHGASFKALVKLGQRKGYRCLGPDSSGLNLYFLRGDIAENNDTTMFEGASFRPHIHRLAMGLSQREQEMVALDCDLRRV